MAPPSDQGSRRGDGADAPDLPGEGSAQPSEERRESGAPRSGTEAWTFPAWHVAADRATGVLELARPEQRLAAALGSIALCRRVVAQLVAAGRQLAAIEGLDALIAAVPALALALRPDAAVALLEVEDDGSVQVRARGGASFLVPQRCLDEQARAAVRAAARSTRRAGGGAGGGEVGARRVGRAVLLPLARGADRWVLAVEPDAAQPPCDPLAPLEIFASLLGDALESARAAAAGRDSGARTAAVLAAIGEGVLVVDPDAVVRGANPAALAALRVRREDVAGRLLRDVPGLAPVAAALARAAEGGEVVVLPRGDVAIRAQPYAHGVVATLRDVTSERAAAERSAAPTARYTFDDLVGAAPAFLRVVDAARRAAASDAPILVCGESGTGKELLAQAIHNASRRARQPFVGINVTAIPRELPESELFGYEGGAFTGAKTRGHAGKFELAGYGTLLLDEIGDMPAELQAKVLRVLQEKVVQPVGSAREIRVHARIIATTHQDLAEAVRAGRLRLDLFHRLCVIRLCLPPLRERKGDVPLLVEHQLRLHAERTGRRVRVTPDALERLESYDWPGNVRELVNLVEGELGVLPAGAEALPPLDVALLRARARATGETEPQVHSLADLERRACEETLARCQGNVARAATELGLPKRTLYARMKRYGLHGPRGRRPSR